MLFLGFAVFAADPDPSVKEGEVSPSDLITSGQSVSNEGTVQGDLIAAGYAVHSTGTVEGGYLAAANEIISLRMLR